MSKQKEPEKYYIDDKSYDKPVIVKRYPTGGKPAKVTIKCKK
jgi:hypothetical protein